MEKAVAANPMWIHRQLVPAYTDGALLLEQVRTEEAEAAYRSDLGLDGKLSRACQHPDNLWSLHGLYECLVRRGEKIEAALIQQRFDLVAARAEIPIGILLLSAGGG